MTAKTEEELLAGELRRYFKGQDDKVEINDGVSVYSRTFYTIDREELRRLEKKYSAQLWCAAARGKDLVHFHFHNVGLMK